MSDENFGTHSEYLKKYIEITDGNILELGCGDFSTGLILDVIKGTNRKLVTVENDKEWHDKIKDKYKPSKNHKYIFTTNYHETCKKLSEYKFSVIFIDSSPWESRLIALYNLINNGDYIIIHDVDYFVTRNLFTFDSLFKSYKYFDEKLPPTVVGSNKKIV